MQKKHSRVYEIDEGVIEPIVTGVPQITGPRVPHVLTERVLCVRIERKLQNDGRGGGGPLDNSGENGEKE